MHSLSTFQTIAHPRTYVYSEASMSNKENDVWLGSAFENFSEAIEVEDYRLAEAICKDTEDAGFVEAARDMRNTLKMSQSE